jgi:hypothetical protein
MPLILKNRRDAFAFRFGRQSGIRSTDDAVEQLQDQLQRERVQHRYNMSVKEQELALVLRELAEVRLELARRDTIEALARAPSPSGCCNDHG